MQNFSYEKELAFYINRPTNYFSILQRIFPFFRFPYFMNWWETDFSISLKRRSGFPGSHLISRLSKYTNAQIQEYSFCNLPQWSLDFINKYTNNSYTINKCTNTKNTTANSFCNLPQPFFNLIDFNNKYTNTQMHQYKKVVFAIFLIKTLLQ